MNEEAQRAQFEHWHKREFPTQPVEWQKHLGRYFYSQVQMRWEAYTAGAADAREQDIALAKCQAEKEEEERNFGRGNAIRMVITKLREVTR